MLILVTDLRFARFAQCAVQTADSCVMWMQAVISDSLISMLPKIARLLLDS